MKLFSSLLLLACTVLASLSATAQPVAGRMISSIGEVTIVRGGERLPGPVGAQVNAGDTIVLGAQSNAQIYFTDSSFVALRPETEFRVREYSFQAEQPEAGRAFFNLLKGGMHTVTGIIGRRNRESYSVGTPVATIGIRGTHYGIVHSDTGFKNADGSTAQAGTYGSVTDGRIGVTNASGSHDFGADQYFYVANAETAPRRLLAPPAFLSDNLAGRSRASASQSAASDVASAGGGQASEQQLIASAAGGGVVAPTSASGGTGDSRISASTALTTVPNANLNTNVFQVTNQATSSVTGLTSIIQPSLTGTIFYYLAGPMNIPTSCSSPPCASVVVGEFILGVNLALQRVTASAALQLSSGQIFNNSIPINLSGLPVTISGNQITFSGTFDRANFPNNGGSFECSQCAPGGVQGFVDPLTISGTISGSQATVTFSGSNVNIGGGGTGSVTATLTQTTPPNNSAAAIGTPVLGGGTDARSQAYFNVQLDSAGRLLKIGPLVGEVQATVGGATNTIVGSDLAAGNLVWGRWTNGTTAATKATFTDNNYATFQAANNSVQPWITGDASNTLPPSLGTLTFTPIGSVFTSTGARLNSASLTADFVNRNLSLSMNVSAPPATAGTNTYQLNATTGFSPTNSRFSGGFNTVTCSGPCNNGVGTASGSFGGFFSGSQAQGAGLALSAGFGAAAGANGVGNGVTGAVALKR